jgi:ACS family hexuronate transporter-like MFS transporter
MPGAARSDEVAPRRSRSRWVVCGLLFLATVVNYVDRQVISVLKPLLEDELGWSELDYANLVFWFQAAYAVGYAGGGRLIDRLGLRLGFALAVATWSLAAMAHAAARSLAAFAAARAALGLAEGANFPAAVKAVGEWFPSRERALATGIFNAGTNVGALLTPLLAPWLAVRFGWPAAFLATGGVGLLWLALWQALYRAPDRHPRVSATELAWIRSDPLQPSGQVAWRALFRHRQTWAFALGMFLVAPVWWFYLFWVPSFLHQRHGLDLLELGPPLVVIYLMTDVGSIGGGWLSSRLIRRGWGVNAARKTALLACALLVTPIVFASRVSELWPAVLLVGLAASAHQGFSANLFTLVSDTVPPAMVSSVVGIGGMAGAVGGMLVAQAVGLALTFTGSYALPFAWAGAAYLLALAVIQLLLPRLEPMRLGSDTRMRT